MKNRKLLIAATVTGLALGGLSASAVASAQGYGGAESADSEVVVEVQESELGGIVLVQEAEEPAPEGTEREGRRGHRGGCNLGAAADVIGIDEADLREAVDAGSTIADVALDNGVSPDAVIEAMVDAKTERIADKVAEGRITQDEADTKIAELTDRITDQVNGTDAGS